MFRCMFMLAAFVPALYAQTLSERSLTGVTLNRSDYVSPRLTSMGTQLIGVSEDPVSDLFRNPATVARWDTGSAILDFGRGYTSRIKLGWSGL